MRRLAVIRFFLGFLSLSLLLASPPYLADLEADAAQPTAGARAHKGIRLLALPPLSEARFDVSIVPPRQGLDRIADALDLIYRHSPVNARVIEALKTRGSVILIYFPNDLRSRARFNHETIALFLPDFLRKGLRKAGDGKEFVVVINHFGVKWPATELAAIIVHELVGHGGQHLRGETEAARVLDLECEASLHEELAYQDLGVEKKSRSVVLFRRQMENRYCRDFRDFMRLYMPKRMALWDRLNPDVPALLEHFAQYRRSQTAELPAPSPAAPTFRSR